MMRPSVQGVDPPVCCVLDVTVTYARDSFVDCQAGPFVLSRGGPGILDVTVTYARDSFVDSKAGPFVLSRGGGPRYPGTSLTPRFGTHRCRGTGVNEISSWMWPMS